MSTSLITRAVPCFALLATLAFPTVAAEPAAQAKSAELVIGDAYKYSLVGQKADEFDQRILVKQTDEWLVFGCLISEGRADACNDEYVYACDLINDFIFYGPFIQPKKVPLLGKWFTKEPVQSFHKSYTWIPRANVRQLEHLAKSNGSVYFAVFKGDTPSLDGRAIPPADSRYNFCVIDNAEKFLDVTSVALAPGEISFTINGEPTKLALTDVRSIHQAMPYDFAKFKAEFEKKQAVK